MKQIAEYLLSKTKKQSSTIEKKELVNKLYDEFGKHYGEFEKIKTEGIFISVEDENELKYHVPPEMIKIAKVEHSRQGNGEIICTWNIDDVLKIYDYDCEKVYKLIKELFYYL